MTRLLILLIIVTLASCQVSNDTLSQWRGEDRKGIFDESGLLKSWPEDGPAELFTIEGLGNGFGSPTFAGEKFYITGEKDSVSYLYCFTLDGRKEWTTELGREWMKTYPGTRSAPTIMGDILYTVNGNGNLYAVDIKSGSLIWSKSFDEYGGIPTMHGFSEAPVIDGDKVFWVPGGKEHNVLALNRFSGEVIWSDPGLGERSGYNQGNLIKLKTRNIFITFSAYHLMGFDTETGDLLWSHEQDNLIPEKRTMGMGDTHCNSVIYDNGFLYYGAGDGNCGVKLKLSADGGEISEVWRNPRFDGYMGGIIKTGDWLIGTSGSKPDLLVLDCETGETADSLRVGIGALVMADDMLYYYEQRGFLRLISFNEGKLQEVSSFRIRKGSREHFAHPVIYRGVLYQRHGDVLVAYDIKAKG